MDPISINITSTAPETDKKVIFQLLVPELFFSWGAELNFDSEVDGAEDILMDSCWRPSLLTNGSLGLTDCDEAATKEDEEPWPVVWV